MTGTQKMSFPRKRESSGFEPRFRLYLTLAVLALALLPACSVKEAARRMSIEVRQIYVKDMSPEGFTANIKLQVNNPNNFGLTIAELDYTAFIAGREVATGRLDKEIEIPAEGSVTADLPVVGRLDLYDDKLLNTLMKGSLDYGVSGRVVFKTWFGSHAVDFDTRKKPRPAEGVI